MEIPSPHAGTVRQVLVKAARSLEGRDSSPPSSFAGAAPARPRAARADGRVGGAERRAVLQTEVVVLGAGPGGYTAAFRAADPRQARGARRALSRSRRRVPQRRLHPLPRTLLHAAEVISEAAEARARGVRFGRAADRPGGSCGRARPVAALDPEPRPSSPSSARSRSSRACVGSRPPKPASPCRPRARVVVEFDHSSSPALEPVAYPGFPYDDERVIDSTGALELRDIPSRLLVIGGGIIAWNATVYCALGSRVGRRGAAGGSRSGLRP